MKVMVCGKGGSGKSSISVIIAKILAKKKRVYLIDSDESNTLLPNLVGVKQPRAIVEYLGGRKGLFDKGEVSIVKALAKAEKGIDLSKLPSDYISYSKEGIGLVTIGKVKNFQEGCACPLNFITKTILKNLVLNDKDFVIVDTDAGVEHIGRGVEEGCDAVIVVADPTAEALSLAKTLKDAFKPLNKEFWLIINKATQDIVEIMREKAREFGLVIDGIIRFDNEVFKSCLQGKPLKANEAVEDVKVALSQIGLL
jgi:CO dehydrogenase maturation factor